MCAYAAGDEAAALAKVQAAQDAMAKPDAEAARAALAQAGDTLTADAAAAGPLAAAMSQWVKAYFTSAMDAYPTLPVTAGTFDAAKMQVKDFYGAVIPASKGDLAAASAYALLKVTTAPEAARDDVAQVGTDLAGAGLGTLNKERALAMMRVTLWAAAPLARAAELVNEKNPKDAGAYLRAAANYLAQEPTYGNKPDLNDIMGTVRDAGYDLSQGLPSVDADDIANMMDAATTQVMEAYPVTGATPTTTTTSPMPAPAPVTPVTPVETSTPVTTATTSTPATTATEAPATTAATAAPTLPSIPVIPGGATVESTISIMKP